MPIQKMEAPDVDGNKLVGFCCPHVCFSDQYYFHFSSSNLKYVLAYRKMGRSNDYWLYKDALWSNEISLFDLFSIDGLKHLSECHCSMFSILPTIIRGLSQKFLGSFSRFFAEIVLIYRVSKKKVYTLNEP